MVRVADTRIDVAEALAAGGRAQDGQPKAGPSRLPWRFGNQKGRRSPRELILKILSSANEAIYLHRRVQDLKKARQVPSSAAIRSGLTLFYGKLSYFKL